MLTNVPTWTTDRVELLKSHFEAGLTCREIAASIGVSRNAVIGKLSRLNLTREKTIDLRRRARKSAKGTVKGPRLKTTPRLQYRMLQAVYAEPEVLFDDDTIGEEHRCSLLELSEQRCSSLIGSSSANGCGSV